MILNQSQLVQPLRAGKSNKSAGSQQRTPEQKSHGAYNIVFLSTGSERWSFIEARWLFPLSLIHHPNPQEIRIIYISQIQFSDIEWFIWVSGLSGTSVIYHFLYVWYISSMIPDQTCNPSWSCGHFSSRSCHTKASTSNMVSAECRMRGEEVLQLWCILPKPYHSHGLFILFWILYVPMWYRDFLRSPPPKIQNGTFH